MMDTASHDTDRLHGAFSTLRDELSREIVGQAALIERLLIALLADGHLLVEGAPGLAKTSAIRALAARLEADFARVQFTPDLLPADLVGTHVYNPKSGDWQVKEGPVFANFVLADEINRAPAKVQSALLEAMQERQVTLAGDTRKLPDPFLVLATQNPVEQEGTYALPEAQIDRFLVKLVVGYPSKQEELKIIDRMAGLAAPTEVQPVTSPQELLRMRQLLDTIYLDDKVKGYIVDLVFATRDPAAVGLDKLKPLILYGASPRASLALARTARARAFLEGRGFVTPQDVKATGLMVMRHRVLTTYEAEAEGITSEQVLQTVFDTVRVP
jgi:MoxR-like ATPase